MKNKIGFQKKCDKCGYFMLFSHCFNCESANYDYKKKNKKASKSGNVFYLGIIPLLIFFIYFFFPTQSKNCNDIAGYYSGSIKVGYVNGTASLNIANNCTFSFKQILPGSGKSTQTGQIQKTGSSYKFKWDDGSTYDVSVYTNSISLSGYNWSCNLSK